MLQDDACYGEKSGKRTREGWGGVTILNRVVREGLNENWHLGKELKEVRPWALQKFEGRALQEEEYHMQRPWGRHVAVYLVCLERVKKIAQLQQS